MTKSIPISVPDKYSADSLRATINHVWTLSIPDRERLGIYILVKTTVGELLQKLDTSHSFIDFITYPWKDGKISCRVNYVNGSTSYLEELSESGRNSDIVLVSIRMARVEYQATHSGSPGTIRDTTTVALVLISPDNVKIDGLNCYNLDGKKWNS